MWSTAFGWLGQLVGLLGSMIPQYFHHETMNVAVSIKRGDRVKVLRYGIAWFWPFWTEIYHRPANIQTKRIPSQTLTTSDRIRVIAGGVVRYHIERDDEDAIRQAMVETDDVDRAIVDETLAVFCEFITGHNFEDLYKSERKAINTKITTRVRAELRRYGVYVDRAQITNLSTCTTIALVRTDAAYSDGDDEENE